MPFSLKLAPNTCSASRTPPPPPQKVKMSIYGWFFEKTKLSWAIFDHFWRIVTPPHQMTLGALLNDVG